MHVYEYGQGDQPERVPIPSPVWHIAGLAGVFG